MTPFTAAGEAANGERGWRRQPLFKQFNLNTPLVKSYAIHWKSSVTGTVGTGTKRFEREEAELLAKELNETYPDIAHEAIIPAPVEVEPAITGPVSSGDDRTEPGLETD